MTWFDERRDGKVVERTFILYILITVFLPVHRAHLKNHWTRDAAIKTRRRGRRNPVSGKTISNLLKGLCVASLPLFLSLCLSFLVAFLFIGIPERTAAERRRTQGKKSYAGNTGDRREQRRKRAADTTAKNAISCRECQAKSRSSGCSKSSDKAREPFSQNGESSNV